MSLMRLTGVAKVWVVGSMCPSVEGEDAVIFDDDDNDGDDDDDGGSLFGSDVGGSSRVTCHFTWLRRS